MENKKINIAEMLKDCPKGMELDCALYENLEFDYIEENSGNAYIVCRVKVLDGYNIHTFTKYGCCATYNYAKCVISPKGKTTWEGFVPPCEFKDGDVIVDKNDNIAIYKQIHDSFDNQLADFYCGFLNNHKKFTIKKHTFQNWGKIKDIRLATEEEKKKLFDAIKSKGYRWDVKTKTLEKLIVPKFKVGDKIKNKDKCIVTIVQIGDVFYDIIDKDNQYGVISIKKQDEWELVHNKFDINTLEPYKSKVLARDAEYEEWKPCMWGIYNKGHNFPYVTTGLRYRNCIPYEGNEHLLGKTDDCDNFFKTWEE